MNMQQINEQMRQDLLKAASDNYSAQLAAQLEAMEQMRQRTEAEYKKLVKEINARYGVTEPVPEVSDDDNVPAAE